MNRPDPIETSSRKPSVWLDVLMLLLVTVVVTAVVTAAMEVIT